MRSLRPSLLLFTVALAGCAGSEVAPPDEGVAEAITGGAADRGYGDHGLVRVADVEPESTAALAYDDDGRMVLLSGSYDDRGLLRAERRLVSGAPDPSFAKAPIPFLASPQGGALEIQPLADGSIIVATTALCVLSTCPHDDDEPGRARRFVFRLTSAGAADSSFAGGEGLLEIPSPQSGALETHPIHLARTPRGEIVVAADQPGDEVELRWLDPSGRQLAQQTLRGARGMTASLAATNDVAFVGRKGGSTQAFATVTGVERATGRTRRGAAEWRVNDHASPVLRQVVVSGASVYVVGDAPHEGDYGPSRIAVHKLTQDLLPDGSFGEGGTKLFNAGNGQGGEMTRIAVLPDGRIVMAGAIEKEGATPHGTGIVPAPERDLGFVVLRPNGAYDTSFAPRGTLTLHAGARREGFTTLAVGPHGVFAAGFSEHTPVGAKLLL